MIQHLGNANRIELSQSESAVEGHPTISTGVLPLAEVSGAAFGVWEARPGVFIGAPHAVEVFIVLSGAATISQTGDGSSVTAALGDVVQLAADVEVRWDISETLRILYVFP